jgi:hypothetical protein
MSSFYVVKHIFCTKKSAKRCVLSHKKALILQSVIAGTGDNDYDYEKNS